MNHTILILNGPNLNMLGTRQPDIYGSETLDDVRKRCDERARQHSLDIDFRQSNSESELVEAIQGARGSHAGIIINAAALSHSSVAILDALLAVDIPVVEVHLSNIHRRDSFRRESYVSQAAEGVICGLGGHGYALAIEAMAEILTGKK